MIGFRSMPRHGAGAVALVAAITLCAFGALTTSTSADAAIEPVPEAQGYDYSAGEPAIWGSVGGTAGAYVDKACSGGYAIAGDSGLFLTTATACGDMIATDGSIRGDAGYYADVFARRDDEPTTLLRLRAGNDAYQLVTDPITGAIPGDGRIRGGSLQG